jgi:predicted nuclease of predicted toxin-antitoxin system
VRILVDECVARPLVDELRRRFDDVLYVADRRPAAPDVDVLAWAVDEQRILITEDYDFGELVFHRQLRAEAVVIIAPGVLGVNLLEDARLAAERLWSAAGELQGRLTIVESKRLRQRPLMTAK